MDPKSLLDYALFQLTPTRTRCDLIVFSGKISEKLASGLVDPFVSHLKYAKDEILKGGYSITLRLPTKNEDASWFTKATFQRFVRFVSTPEILERIIRIEKEILQIDGSTQSNEIPIREVTGQPGEVADGITKKSSNSSKLNTEEVDGAAREENSRVRLQRLMDTRKALLQKEQAMAYARAVVAGYEIETIDGLICFADTFGASRLRVACIDFKELYKKKHSDDQWMGELAAVQAYPIADLSFMGSSGIMLAGDNMPLVRTVSSEPISDTTVTSANSDSSKENNPATEQTPNLQQQVPWMNQIPQYMYNYQGQPISPYQSYPFPGMHPAQQYYAGHMGWPAPGGITPKNQKNHKSSRRKDANGTDANEEDEETPSSGSYSQTDSEEEKEHEKKNSSKGHKRNKKKNSKTVVIRNINYITSQRRNGEENEDTDDSSSLDESFIREGVDDALASLEKYGHSKPSKNRAKWSSVSQNGSNGYAEEIDANNSEGGKATNPWGAFQDILMNRDESIRNENNKSLEERFMMRGSIDGISEKTGNLYLESEKIKMKPITGDDSVLAIQRNGESVTKANMMDFANGEYIHPSGKKIISENENSLFLNHSEESRTALPDFSSESSTLKSRRGEDWFVVNSSGGSVTHEGKNDPLSYERGIIVKEADTRNSLVDDSFIIESRPTVNEQYVSNWRTDINMEADIDRNENISGPEKPKPNEPDEFCMMLVRESHESVAESWKPEMDYEVEISFNEADKALSPVKVNEDPVVNGKIVGGKKNVVAKNGGKDAKPKTVVSKSRLDFLSKSKKVSPVNRTLVHKSKLEKEEEERKRMEEIRIQRQKRIAERSATGSSNKKIPVGNKTTPPKLGKD